MISRFEDEENSISYACVDRAWGEHWVRVRENLLIVRKWTNSSSISLTVWIDLAAPEVLEAELDPVVVEDTADVILGTS